MFVYCEYILGFCKKYGIRIFYEWRDSIMKDNFIKIAAITPDIRVGDTEFNTESIIKDIHAAAEEGLNLLFFQSYV